MLRTRIGDIGLHVVDAGAGPVIMFVHGFPLDHTMWRHQLEAFRHTHRVIMPDLRGFGESETSSGIVSMARFADDLAELLVVLEVDQPIVLCGLSMGGYIALEMWQRHPSRIGAMILCDTRASADSEETARGRDIMAQRVMLDGAQTVADAMIPKLLAAQTLSKQPRLVEQLHRTMARSSAVAIAAAQRGMARRQDFTDRLSSIDCPCLVLGGEHDVITPVDEMRAMAEKLPRGRFELIPGAGHMAPLENPAAVNPVIRQFLESLAGGNA
jgi:pimeloyl-ACP methyl ester carboxylesterase